MTSPRLGSPFGRAGTAIAVTERATPSITTAADVFLRLRLFCLFTQLFSQVSQAVQGLEEGVFFFGEVEADQVVHRLPEEAGTGNSAHAYQPRQILAEFQIAVIAELGNVQ